MWHDERGTVCIEVTLVLIQGNQRRADWANVGFTEKRDKINYLNMGCVLKNRICKSLKLSMF